MCQPHIKPWSSNTVPREGSRKSLLEAIEPTMPVVDASSIYWSRIQDFNCRKYLPDIIIQIKVHCSSKSITWYRLYGYETGIAETVGLD